MKTTAPDTHTAYATAGCTKILRELARVGRCMALFGLTDEDTRKDILVSDVYGLVRLRTRGHKCGTSVGTSTKD